MSLTTLFSPRTADTKQARAARACAADRQRATDEIARLTEALKPLESAHKVAANDWQVELDAAGAQRREPDQALAAPLKAAEEAVPAIYTALEGQRAALAATEQKLTPVAEAALRNLYPAALQTRTEIGRLDEIEAKLLEQKTALERDTDPDDDAKMKELESVCLRLSVIPGKRDRWVEKLTAQSAELALFWEKGTHALGRAVSDRQSQARTRFLAALAPFFEGGKLPPVVESDAESLFRETTFANTLAQVESSGRIGSWKSHFEIDAVPPLLAAFDALAKLENP